MSSPRVELVYFPGCPHADAARAAVREALAAQGAPAEWHEWNRDDPRTPQRLRHFGSPTVLVDGRDVSPAAADGDCCRLYVNGGRLRPAPGVESIRAALQGRMP